MKRILIADASKASLVMTSEVFKDHYPGIQVLVARNSAEAVQLAKTNKNIDAFIVDFDLPDLNGAQTALMLKKISKTPILITAFDNEEVDNLIDKLLKKYDDCKSWLKKPISSEVVIAVAQRYCEGKIRVQKRVSCVLPALAKMEIKQTSKPLKQPSTESKTKQIVSKGKTTKTKKDPAIPTKIELIPLSFHGIIEDCSLSGIKLKPSKQTLNGTTEWTKLLNNMESISSGTPVTIKIPSFLDIEFGKVSELSKLQIKQIEKEKPAANRTKLKKAETNITSLNPVENHFQEMDGKILWTNADSGEWCIGIEFENQSLSKRLFEAIVSLQSRQQKTGHKQSIMKTSRTA